MFSSNQPYVSIVYQLIDPDKYLAPSQEEIKSGL